MKARWPVKTMATGGAAWLQASMVSQSRREPPGWTTVRGVVRQGEILLRGQG